MNTNIIVIFLIGLINLVICQQSKPPLSAYYDANIRKKNGKNIGNIFKEGDEIFINASSSIYYREFGSYGTGSYSNGMFILYTAYVCQGSGVQNAKLKLSYQDELSQPILLETEIQALTHFVANGTNPICPYVESNVSTFLSLPNFFKDGPSSNKLSFDMIWGTPGNPRYVWSYTQRMEIYYFVLNVEPKLYCDKVGVVVRDGFKFDISLLFSDPGGIGDAPFEVLIDWEDGTTNSTIFGLQQIINSTYFRIREIIDHSYESTISTYSIKITVTDKDGDPSNVCHVTGLIHDPRYDDVITTDHFEQLTTGVTTKLITSADITTNLVTTSDITTQDITTDVITTQDVTTKDITTELTSSELTTIDLTTLNQIENNQVVASSSVTKYISSVGIVFGIILVL